MNILKKFNKEKIKEGELVNYRHRKATRGVIFDKDNNIAILEVSNGKYYELPGGGLEENETVEECLIRECKEEIGCDIDIIKYIGDTLEYRKKLKVLNKSHAYIGKVKGEKNKPLIIGNENEYEKKYKILWINIDKAIKLIEKSIKQDNLYDQYTIERDLILLNKAKELIN